MLGYITRGSMKAQHKAEESTWRAIGDRCQASQDAEVKSWSDHESESQPAKQSTTTRSKTPCAQNTAQSSRNQTSDKGSDDSNSLSPANVSTKYKRRRSKPSVKRAAKKQKRRNPELSQEEPSKLMTFHLLRDIDPEARIQRENIKKISEPELIFGALSLELCTVLQIFHESDSLAVKKRPQAVWHAKLIKKGQQGLENANLDAIPWSFKDNLLCFKGKWYVLPGLLRKTLLKQHHDNPYAGHYGYCKTLDLLEKKFFWAQMSTDIREYTESCKTCRRTKPACHLPHGELQLLSLPKGPR